jgi:hypothetical protein
MPIAIRPDSVIRKSPVPTLAQMVREAQEFSKPKLKRLTREALLEGSTNLNGYGLPARTTIYGVRGSLISLNGSAWISHRRTSWSN